MIAAALAGNAPVIVTGDRDLLNGEQLTEWLAERGIEVIRPVELLRRLDQLTPGGVRQPDHLQAEVVIGGASPLERPTSMSQGTARSGLRPPRPLSPLYV